MGLLYEQVKKDIEKKIGSNEFKKGEYLPNELELQKMYGVSRTTIRKAVSVLIQEGTLTIVRGKGTLVEPSKLKHKISSLMSFTELIKEQGFSPSIKGVTVDRIKASKMIASKLKINEDEEVFKISRIRIIDNQPITINISYISCNMAPDFNVNMLKKEQSLYKILEDDYNIIVHATEDEITAIKADAGHAKILNSRKNDPLLCIKRVAFDGNNTPVEFGEILIRSDRYKHIIVLRK